MNLTSHHVRNRSRRGALLIEFALLALVLYLLIAVTIDIGRAIYTSQVLQDAARVTARELAVTPLNVGTCPPRLPPDCTLDEALQDGAVRARVFNPDHLVIDLDTFASQADLDAFLGALPVANKALRPIMIFDRVEVGGATRNLLRYPGALLADPSTSTGFAVGIPRVVARGATGVETIEWIPVITEVRPDPADPTTGPFSINDVGPPRTQKGLVAIALNYPFQAAATSSFRTSPDGPFEPNGAFPNEADDAGVTQSNAPPQGTVQVVAPSTGPYAGPFGLGRQLALGREVRPFRRLLTAQAIYRREVFE